MCQWKTLGEISAVSETQQDIVFLGSVSTEGFEDPWLVKLYQENMETELKIDTGAHVTVIPADMYSMEQFGKLQRSNKIW